MDSEKQLCLNGTKDSGANFYYSPELNKKSESNKKEKKKVLNQMASLINSTKHLKKNINVSQALPAKKEEYF